jgi:hypothetical protein
VASTPVHLHPIDPPLCKYISILLPMPTASSAVRPAPCITTRGV